MSEREDHFDLGSGWPPWGEVPSDYRGIRKSPRFRVGMLIIVASPFIAIAIGVRLFTSPPAAGDSQRAATFSGPPVKTVPIVKLRETAIAEVKKREGWSGQADITAQEGNTYYFFLKRDPAEPEIGVQVGVNCVSGTVNSYVSVP